MAIVNPKGRVNYEPNSWGAQESGPRESPETGFHPYPAEEEGATLRTRSETFADHYSQARQFYLSQTEIEQTHISEALIFELSKVERPEIRTRLVSHLLNIENDLAKRVADGLRLKEMPAPADAAKPTQQELKKSPTLSILLNGPNSFRGRKVGTLVTDGVDINILTSLKAAVEEEGAMLEIVAPQVGGVRASDGTWIEAKQKIAGGPSVLYDAVALLPSQAGAEFLAQEACARDFVADAFAHAKFIGFIKAAAPLLLKAGVPEDLDEGFIALYGAAGCTAFITACRQLRFWAREAAANCTKGDAREHDR
jgi:catalase